MTLSIEAIAIWCVPAREIVKDLFRAVVDLDVHIETCLLEETLLSAVHAGI